MTDYNDGKWHGWNGGECPVHPKSRVQWMRYTGFGGYFISYQGESLARDVSWMSAVDDPHIVAFRVVKEHREPREFWIVLHIDQGMIPSVYGTDPRHISGHKMSGSDEIIHVREVLE